MEVHSAHAKTIEAQLAAITAGMEKRKVAEPFQDPIREFHRASRVEGTVRNWLTYQIDDRKKMMESGQFDYIPKQDGERDQDFETRNLERWRSLCVIIQEESRAKAENQSPEMAIMALKKLFPSHPWPKPKA